MKKVSSFNVGRLSCLGHHLLNPFVCSTLAVGFLLAFTDCFAVPSGARHEIWNVKGVTVTFAMLAFDWLAHWLRLIIELALVLVTMAVVSPGFPNRRHAAKQKSKQREHSEVSLALERAQRLNAEAQTRTLTQRLLMAREEERRRLARELHDDVTQRLARLAIDAAKAERAAPPLPTTARGAGCARNWCV